MTGGTPVLRIGTRGSALALWQANHVTDKIRRLPGSPSVELVRIKTEGDRIVDVPLSGVSGKAFFTLPSSGRCSTARWTWRSIV